MDLTTQKYPQRDWVKNICQAFYYVGLGKFWYEEYPQSNLKKLMYQIWMVITNVYNFSMTINVYLANFRTDLDTKEQNDLVQFMLAHGSISGKIIFLYYNKDRIIELIPRLLGRFRSAIVVENLDKACVSKSRKISLTILGVCYATILMTTCETAKMYFEEGIPFRTEVTYYPSKSDTGLAVNILRFFIQLHWWFAVGVMVAIDSLCITALFIVGHKFKVLQIYFDNMRAKVLENVKTKSQHEVEREFRNDFVIGIQIHDDALWCAAHVQSALGNLYSVQIFESFILLMMCLIKMVTVERNLIYLVANLGYIGCLIFVTGCYMMPAGDITHEASLVGGSMFHCGWELATSRETRVLAVQALQRSQSPVTMSAFGILTLSYSNFISVIRSSYSFFAVMY